VSERITLADVTLTAELQSAFSTTVDATLRSKLPNLLRHFDTVVNHPKLTSVFGSTAFIEKALQYTPPPKEKKEKAPAAPPQPKAEKKPKKEEVDDDDGDDKPYEEAPKEKNPLDLLPKSTFNLEDWKRAYSNKDTRGPGGALEWLYEKFVLLLPS
jgi:elongation factor 1-gamma